MAIDLGSIIVSFILGKVADQLLQQSPARQLAKKLRRTVEEWSKTIDPPISAYTLQSVFSDDVDNSRLSQFSARRNLQESIRNKRVPTQSEICEAVLESWDEIKAGRPDDDLDPFFRLPRDEAATQIDDLATRIRTVLQEDDSLFKVTVVEQLESLHEKSDRIESIVEIASQTHGEVQKIRTELTEFSRLLGQETFNNEIETAARNIRERKYKEAIGILDHLQDQAWSRLDPRARYRVLANKGIAYQATENYDDAAELFLQAK